MKFALVLGVVWETHARRCTQSHSTSVDHGVSSALCSLRILVTMSGDWTRSASSVCGTGACAWPCRKRGSTRFQFQMATKNRGDVRGRNTCDTDDLGDRGTISRECRDDAAHLAASARRVTANSRAPPFSAGGSGRARCGGAAIWPNTEFHQVYEGQHFRVSSVGDPRLTACSVADAASHLETLRWAW